MDTVSVCRQQARASTPRTTSENTLQKFKTEVLHQIDSYADEKMSNTSSEVILKQVMRWQMILGGKTHDNNNDNVWGEREGEASLSTAPRPDQTCLYCCFLHMGRDLF